MMTGIATGHGNWTRAFEQCQSLGTDYAEGNRQVTELQKRGLRKAAKSWAMWEGLGLASRWGGVHISGSEPCLPIYRAPENSRACRQALGGSNHQALGSWEGSSPKQGSRFMLFRCSERGQELDGRTPEVWVQGSKGIGPYTEPQVQAGEAHSSVGQMACLWANIPSIHEGHDCSVNITGTQEAAPHA